MGSPNGSLNSRPMPRPHVCKICGKHYAMSWAYSNHMNRHKNEGEEYPLETNAFRKKK